jgi:hypothetical protein
MAFDPRSYIRVLAVRHAIPREPGDHDGSEQARRALTAELNELKEFAVRARALNTLVRTITSHAEDTAGESPAAEAQTNQDARHEAEDEQRSKRERPAHPYKPCAAGAYSTGAGGSRRRRDGR